MRSILRTVRRDDLRDAAAIAAAVSVVGASFGALATAAGVPWPLTVGLSVLVLAGGSQFLAVAVVTAGGGPVAAVAGGLLLNARHVPLGLAVAPVVGDRLLARVVGAHLLIDESVAFARSRGTGSRARAAYWTCGILLCAGWQAGTVAGILAGAAVPDPAAFGVDAAFPAGLLALLLPTLAGRDARRVGTAAAVAALAATPLLPAGLPVLAGLAGLAGLGAAGRGRRVAVGSEPAGEGRARSGRPDPTGSDRADLSGGGRAEPTGGDRADLTGGGRAEPTGGDPAAPNVACRAEQGGPDPAWGDRSAGRGPGHPR